MRLRRHNLALVLDHIHRDGALTRAELTQRLEVSRSTMGALVADLIHLGLLAAAGWWSPVAGGRGGGGGRGGARGGPPPARCGRGEGGGVGGGGGAAASP